MKGRMMTVDIKQINHKAFTLIELLVVIAIIALLLSIVMPALRKVKKQAKSVICKTNLKSLTTANRMYVEDNGGALLFFDGTLNSLWTMNIGHYLEEIDKVRYCPEASESKFEQPVGSPLQVNGAQFTPWALWNADEQRYELGSYSINNWMYGPNPTPGWDWMGWGMEEENMYFKASAIRNTSLVPVFLDGVRFGGAAKNELAAVSQIDWEIGSIGGGTSFQICRYLINRHSKNGNIAYFDGHVETVYLPDYFMQKWHKNSKPNAEAVEEVVSTKPFNE